MNDPATLKVTLAIQRLQKEFLLLCAYNYIDFGRWTNDSLPLEILGKSYTLHLSQV